MQNHCVISLYPETGLPAEPYAYTLSRRERKLQTLAAVVDLTVTAAIGLGILLCFGLVFTML